MHLSPEQIQTLFAFTRKKFVPYYDLQIEIVDHLASSIEEEMTLDQHLSFEKALQKVYARFGIFGFAHVVQERQATLEKQHQKLWRQTLKGYFTLPKIAFTLAIFLSTYSITPFLNLTVRVMVIYLLFTSFSVVDWRQLFLQQKMPKKLLLLTQYTASFPTFFIGVWVILCIANSTMLEINAVFAGLVTFIVVMQLAIFQIYKLIRRKAMQLYPEAFATAC